MTSELSARIVDGSARVGVIGLGYVGLPVAAMLARCGFRVTGVDIDTERVERINAGASPIGGDEPGVAELIAETVSLGCLHATTDHRQLADTDVVLICVDTPVDEHTHRPSYAALRSALASLGQVLTPGTLVIVESTIAPGTMTRIVIPEIEGASHLRAGVDFFVGHCPERVMPGVLIHNLTHMSRPVGGQTREVAEVMASLYAHYVQGELDLTDMLTAELVKTGENAYRDVQIAFANEMALICEQLGADVFAVRELLNKSPGRAMLMPGAGVGGHCIPKDPWLLIANVVDDVPMRVIPAARAVNDGMPGHVVDLLESALRSHQVDLADAQVAVLGYAFRENTDDARESPSQYLLGELARAGCGIRVHDPHVPEFVGPIEDTLRGADAAVIMVAHRDYLNIDPGRLKNLLRTPVVVDGRRVLSSMAGLDDGLTYVSVGVGN
jgi:UDP-N-acetyl-D-mannosaminuronic acid dehydrogenase